MASLPFNIRFSGRFAAYKSLCLRYGQYPAKCGYARISKLANTNAFQITKHSKRFWHDRVYRPEIKSKDGSTDISPNYAVRLSHAGRSMRLSLRTPNQAAAADLALTTF